MTDQPPAPGWWKASDGNWYPPQPPAPQPTQQQPAVPQPQYPQQPTQQQPVVPQYGAPVPPPPGYPPQQQYGQPQGYPPQGGQPTAPKKKSNLPLILVLVAVVVVGAIVGAILVANSSDDAKKKTTAAPKTTGKNRQTDMTLKSTPRSTVPGGDAIVVQNDDGSDANKLVKAALTDILGFWGTEMQATFKQAFQPITGGYWAATPNVDLPPCAQAASDIAGNAFYCSKGDNVAWDASGLIPDTAKTYGPLAVGVILAHEIGHAVQARVGMSAKAVTLEQQADCYAGTWVKHLVDKPNPEFAVSDASVDTAMAGFLDLADQPGTSAADPSAHGSAFDRLNSFQQGLESGSVTCAAFTDSSVAATLTEIQFSSQAEANSGGNLPYDQIANLTVTDLEDFWSKVFPQTYKTKWTPLQPIQPFDGTAAPCGGEDASGFALFYCKAGDYVAFDNTKLFPAIASEIGDFAMSTLIATQYGLAVADRLGAMPSDPKEQNLLGDCLAGSWTSSVFVGDRPDSAQLSLSPGDLDETAKALLFFSSTSASTESGQGTGYQRVKSFRTGLIDGVSACIKPQ